MRFLLLSDKVNRNIKLHEAEINVSKRITIVRINILWRRNKPEGIIGV